MRLPALGAFVEDRNGNVAWSELGVHGVAFPGGQRPGALPGRAICRGRSFLEQKGEHRRVRTWEGNPYEEEKAWC